jgi:hypothetical protein
MMLRMKSCLADKPTSIRAQAGGLVMEDGGGVCLAEEENRHQGEEAFDHREDPEDPPPALGCGLVAACNGTDDGAERGAQSVDCEGPAAFLLPDEVGDCAAACEM